MEQETRLRTPGREEERGYLRVRAGPDPKAPGSGDWAVAGAQGGAQWVEEGGRKQRQASVDFKPGWEGKGREEKWLGRGLEGSLEGAAYGFTLGNSDPGCSQGKWKYMAG